MLNDAGPPQRVDPADYHDPASLRRFAEDWRAGRRGKWLTTDRLADSCVLLRRSLCETVEGASCRSPVELAARVRAAGKELAVAHDLFVHHIPSGDPDPGPGADIGWRASPVRLAAKGAAPGPRGGRRRARPRSPIRPAADAREGA